MASANLAREDGCVYLLAESAGILAPRLGLRCSYCCANLIAMLLVIGVMDLSAMTAVTAAITVERLAPAACVNCCQRRQ